METIADWAALTPAQVTAPGLASAASMPLSRALRAATPEVRSRVGLVKWAAAWPAWAVLTVPGVLAVLLRVAIEMAIGVFAPGLLPIALAVLAILRVLLAPAYRLDDARSAGGLADAVTALAREAERYRRDPRTAQYLDAIERLLKTPTREMSLPARVGLGVIRDDG